MFCVYIIVKVQVTMQNDLNSTKNNKCTFIYSSFKCIHLITMKNSNCLLEDLSYIPIYIYTCMSSLTCYLAVQCYVTIYKMLS